MTIKDVADSLGITTAAIYKGIKAHGMKVSDLVDPSTKHLTKDGEAAVLDLFKDRGSQQVINELKTEVTRLITESTAQKEEISRLTAENASLMARATTAEGEAASLRDQLTHALEAVTKGQEALDRAQQLQALTLARIPPALPAHKPGFFERLFHRKEGAPDANT